MTRAARSGVRLSQPSKNILNYTRKLISSQKWRSPSILNISYVWLKLVSNFGGRVSFRPEESLFRKICFHPDLMARSSNCVHFVSKRGCKDMAWCIYDNGENLVLRRHKIGECPNSEYRRFDDYVYEIVDVTRDRR